MGNYLTNLVQKILNLYVNMFGAFVNIIAAAGNVLISNYTLTAFVLVMLVIRNRSFSLTKNIKSNYSK